jgi:hypothetical protein
VPAEISSRDFRNKCTEEQKVHINAPGHAAQCIDTTSLPGQTVIMTDTLRGFLKFFHANIGILPLTTLRPPPSLSSPVYYPNIVTLLQPTVHVRNQIFSPGEGTDLQAVACALVYKTVLQKSCHKHNSKTATSGI